MMAKNAIYDLKSKCYGCKKCPLGRRTVEGMDPHVFANGNVNSKIIFIGEAPGKNEVIVKTPLVGRAGKFYDEKILGVAGIERRKIYTTNAVLCRPNEKNRNPLPAEIEECQVHLDAQICLIDPVLLVVLGNIPLFAVCGTIGISKKRGKLIWSKKWSNDKSYPVLPLFHPAYCLRGSGLKEMQQDAEFLGKLVNDIRQKQFDWKVSNPQDYKL